MISDAGDRPARVIVGGVGYRHLRDHSLGIVMSDELAPWAHAPRLLVEDLSYNPVAVAQWLADEGRTVPVARAIFMAAVAREDGRPPGTISAYRWDRALPAPHEVQRAMTDAVTGVIHLDNTLVVTGWMRALPPEVIVVEVEPLEHAFGDDMSAPVAAAYRAARRLVMRYATSDAAGHALPIAPFGGRGSPVAVSGAGGAR